MSNLVTDSSALAAVRAFLGPRDSEASESGEEQAPVARPARLGLGAKWVGQNLPGGGAHGSAAVGARRLGASLRVEKAYGQTGDSEESSDSNEDDSRARVAARNARKRLRIRRSFNKKELLELDRLKGVQKNDAQFSKQDSKDQTQGIQKKDAQFSKQDSKDQTQKVVTDRTTRAGGSGSRKQHKLPAAKHVKFSDEDSDVDNDSKLVLNKTTNASECQDSTGLPSGFSEQQADTSGRSEHFDGKSKSAVNWQGPPLKTKFGPHGVLKKRKIRSRQKNLKKDKRPKHLLPAHLTEETLRAGRVTRPSPTTTLPTQSS